MSVRFRPALVFLLLAPYALVFYAFLALRRASASLRPRHPWRTWVSPNLLIGGFLLPGDVVELRRLGVRAVINVSRELYDPVLALRAAGVEYLRIPCWDMGAPTLEEAARGVAFLERHIVAGHRVHVHCASGVGRSVTLALCYLATRGGIEVGEALALIERRRPRVALRPVQRAFVERYVAWHRAHAERRARAAPPVITSGGGGTSG
ncbi:dual specificity protein phosphatase family protein [Sorangium sp. So ce448]|uniref:protein-tyrosine phosphatase family protein n=1 Tax=Sorangium sp. So ce448 TaxID=3133314 RepID=UPI003F646EF8